MKHAILIVEDETNMRRILEAILRREGYDTFIAVNGLEAIRELERHYVSAILSDLKMPGMDGLELLREVNLAYPEIPVVIITAHGSIETAVNAMKMGAFDFITKPFEQDEIKLVMAKAVRSFDYR
ncbi:response regulator, partial [bacterium]|nr:response regulator [candidate division CSSED10-310 bacterium]